MSTGKKKINKHVENYFDKESESVLSISDNRDYFNYKALQKYNEECDS